MGANVLKNNALIFRPLSPTNTDNFQATKKRNRGETSEAEKSTSAGENCRFTVHQREKLMSASQSLGFSVVTERADGLTSLNFMQFKQFHRFTEHPALALSIFPVSLADSSFITF